MCPQRDDKIVNTVGGVVRSQDDRFVLPLIVAGVSVAAVFANLRQLQTAERFLFFQQVTQRWTDANIRRDRRKPLYNTAQKMLLNILFASNVVGSNFHFV